MMIKKEPNLPAFELATVAARNLALNFVPLFPCCWK